MTRLALGFLCGLLAIGLRRPPGASLLELPAASGELALLGRAAALAVAGVVVLAARRSLDGKPNEDLLLGAALGVLAEGLIADLRPDGPGGMWALAPVALVLLLVRERRRPATPPPEVTRSGFVPALFLAGGGLALALDPLARVARRFGGGPGAEDALVLGLFLLLAAFGGLAFGSPLRAGRDRAGSRAALVAAAAAAPLLLVAWAVLAGQVVSPVDRRVFLDRFGLDPSLEEQLHVTGTVATIALLLPAFATGLAVSCARWRGELAALLLGAATATLFQARVPGMATTAVGPIVLAVAAVVGALEPGVRFRDRGRIPTAAAAVVAVACAFAHVRLVVPAVLPWQRFPVVPSHAHVGAWSQLLVLPRGPGVTEVLLDRTAIAPHPDRAGADAEQLRIAMQLAPEREGGPRVLLVGQLTPGRAWVLAEEGAGRVDRTAAWWRYMDHLETILFADMDTPRSPGEVRSLGSARSALDAGEYDLVVVPAVTGGAPPHLPDVSAPEGTVVVAWVDWTHELAQRRLDGPVLLATDGLDHPAIALTAGVDLALEPAPGQPGRLDVGVPLAAPSLGTYGFERPEDRDRRARAALARRLANAHEATAWNELCAGLAKHYAAQEPSSPWERNDVAARTELDDDALTHLLAAAARAEDPDRVTLGVWNGLVDVLVGKRDVEAIWTWVEPVTELWADWPAGAIALAHADLESLDPEAADARLAPLAAASLDPATKARLRRARVALARGLRDAGLVERAREIVRGLLEEDPEDREAWGLLAPEAPEDG